MFNDKIIFTKGETEKLINYQFYNSSYKACCEIKKQNSMDNNCFKTNYQNNIVIYELQDGKGYVKTEEELILKIEEERKNGIYCII